MHFSLYLQSQKSESSSVGRARPCQGRGREFESRLSLQNPSTSEVVNLKSKSPARMVELVDTQDLKSCALNRRAGSIPAPSTLCFSEYLFHETVFVVFSTSIHSKIRFYSFSLAIEEFKLGRRMCLWYISL